MKIILFDIDETLLSCKEEANSKGSRKMFNRVFQIDTDEEVINHSGKTEKAIIEEYILGTQVNFNFFYSTLHKRLELIGTDTRRQTNLDGFSKLTSEDEASVLMSGIRPSYEEAGHVAVTVLESLLEQAFDIGERFVAATKDIFAPGVIGPFALQTMIIPGPPKKDIVVFDVSPRMPGSPGIAATPYSSYLYGRPVSMGERVAMEIKEAIEKNQLDKIVT